MKKYILALTLFASPVFGDGINVAAISSQQQYNLKANVYSDGSFSGTGDKVIKVGPFGFATTSKRKLKMLVIQVLGQNPNDRQIEAICEATKRFGRFIYRFCK